MAYSSFFSNSQRLRTSDQKLRTRCFHGFFVVFVFVLFRIRSLSLRQNRVGFCSSFSSPRALLPFLNFQFQVTRHVISIFIRFRYLRIASTTRSVGTRVLSHCRYRHFHLFAQASPIYLFPRTRRDFLRNVIDIFLTKGGTRNGPRGALPRFNRDKYRYFFTRILL